MSLINDINDDADKIREGAKKATDNGEGEPSDE